MPHPPTVLLHASARAGDIDRAIGTARTLHKNRPERRIRIIVNGPALTGVTVDAKPLDLSHLPDNTSIEACEVGLKVHDIPTDALQPGIRTVPSAIVALTDAQLDGAAYVRV